MELRRNVTRKIFKHNLIYAVVIVISVLMITSIVLTYYNNSIIQRNRAIQIAVEDVKTGYDQIGKSVIHSLDIGLRGYALVRNQKFAAPLESALRAKDSIINDVEVPLRELNYDFQSFNAFKDSLNAYTLYCSRLKRMLDESKMQEFMNEFVTDKGGHLYWQYLQVEADIEKFLDKLSQNAQQNYSQALFRNQIILIALFVICFPTLLYTAYYTTKTFKLAELLQKFEADRNKVLLEQNATLEQRVAERMREITDQNKEINSQREELSEQRDALSIQNKQLVEAHKTIELQNAEIQSMNRQLAIEVQNRTQELREANKELIQQNNQLEQFAYIAAHNLRSPLTRIMGLANLIHVTDSQDDKTIALERIVTSVQDLDQVIRDLNTILNIKRHTGNLEEVELGTVLGRVKRVLEKEIEDTHAVITSNFDEVNKVYAVTAYIESVLYNLISNAIKYRDPSRIPFITIESTLDGDSICLTVSDNGLGIDLTKHKHQIFSLYKRFHLHMEGKGLGLYLVKTQIQALGGRVEVKSEPNEGTTFFIYFKRYLI
jgi:signal transduction histidine kinase